MKTQKLKKIAIYSVVLFQFSSYIPWQAVPVFAEGTETSATEGEAVSKEPREKIEKKDLPAETQQKLDEAAKQEIGKSEVKEKNEPTDKIEIKVSEKILEDFQQEEKSSLAQVVEAAVASGKEEILTERTELTKTFIDPKTGIGETILFTQPIHEKDQQGTWQEKETTIKEKTDTLEIENDNKVVVPKESTKNAKIQVEEEKQAIELGLPKENYEVIAVNENKVLLGSDQENEPAEVSTKDGVTELSQYVDKELRENGLVYQLGLPEGSEASLKKETGAIEITTNEKTTVVIPAPTLNSLSGEMIAPLSLSFDESSKAIQVKGIKKEILEKVGQAKVSLRAVSTNVTVNGVNSTSIRQYNDLQSYYNQNYMMIGYDNGYSSGDEGAAHFQTYGVLSIPSQKFMEITRTHEIMSATLKMKRIGEPGFWGDTAKDGNGNIVSRLFEVSAINKDIGSLTSLTYDKFIRQLGAPYGPPIHEDGKETRLAGINVNSRWVDFDITNAANDWKNGTQNFGVIVKNNKMSAHEMPYSQAELFGGKGWTGGEPYVVFTHRERPPIDKNMPLKDTTMKLRPFVRSDNDGLVQFAALGLDGGGRPEAEITYRLKDKNDNNKVIYTGTEPSIGRDYLYPNYPELFKDAQKYLELSSNWQTKDLLTSVLKENHLYQTEATIRYTKNGKNESAEKTYDSFQLYKVSSQDTLSRLLAFYGLEKNRASFMRDNNMKDEMLTQGNLVFIRNPKKNAGKAYTPKPLTNAEKIRLDSLSMGRGKHCQFGFEPLNIGSGNFIYDMTDSTWFDGEEEGAFTRTYNAMGQGQDSAIGRNWTLNQLLSLNQLSDKSMMFTLPEGGKVFFKRKADGSYEVEDTLPFTLKKEKEIVEEIEKRLFILQDTKEQLTYTFDATGQIRSIKNAVGQTKKYTYHEESGFLKEIILFNGKKIAFKWDENAHLTEVTFPDGTKNQYNYDSEGNLVKVIDALGKTFTYHYDKESRMTSYAGNDGKMIYQNEYDKESRVIKQTDAVGNVVTLEYGKQSTTTIDANGNKTITTFNDHYQPVKVVYEDGTTEISSYNKAYQLTEFVNRKGAKTNYVYDNKGNLTSTTYPDGTQENTTYNEWSQPLVETKRQGKTITHTYDKQGNEVSRTDENGNTTTYEYNGKGERIKEIDPLAQSKTFSYVNGNIASVSDTQGVQFAYTYDARGLLLTETDGKGRTKNYERNARGELVKETDFNGAVKTYAYDSEGNKTSETDFNGNKTSYAYDAIGRLIKETNPLGGVKTYKYDGNGNLVEESDYLGNLKKMKYNALNQRTEQIFPDGTKAVYEYDALGNVIKETLPNGSSTSYRYDVNNHLTEEVNGKGHVTTYEHNSDGQPIKVIYPNLTEESFTYDGQGNILTYTAKNGKVTTYTYNGKNDAVSIKDGNRERKQSFDSRGNLVKETDALGQEQSIHFDEAGYAKESIEADGSKTTYETDAQGNVTKTITPDGAVFQYSYDANGNKTKDVAPDGTTTLYTYNALNLLATIVQPTGDIEQYSYDANGNVTKKIDPMGGVTSYSYTNTNELQTTTDALGNLSTFEYDAGGNLASFKDSLGRITTYQYNELNQLEKETSPMGVVTSYLYDKAGQLSEVEDSTAQTEGYTYNAMGLLTSVTDSLGRKEHYTYNLFGELISETDIAGNKTSYEYDALGRVIKTISPKGTEEINTYDHRNQVTSTVKHNGGKITYQYDAVGNLVQELNAKNQTKIYQYNQNRQLTQLTDENGGTTKFAYDTLGRVIETTDANGNRAKQNYDANGNIIKEIDGQGNETTHAYDALNRLVETIDAKGFKQSFTYDAGGRKISESDFKGNKTTFSYDQGDNVVETQDALKRKTTFSYDLRNQLTLVEDSAKAKTSYRYNQDGTLASEENAKGYQLSYHYDALSQLIKTTDNVHKQPLTEWEYNQFGQVVKETKAKQQITTMTYDKVGRLTNMTYPNKTSVGYTYDVMDRVDKMTDVRGNDTSFIYDGLGNVKELIAPNEAKTVYNYDANNNLLKETDPLNFATTFAYNKNNQLIEAKDANGGMTTQQYDQRNLVESVKDAVGSKQTFAYDGNGNQTKHVDSKGHESLFSYDVANRLTSTTNRLGKVTSYAYDTQDNLTKITDANQGETTFEYSPVGELEKQISANGKKETFEYRLDGQLAENKKANDETISYHYDELNRMIGKQTNNQDFVYEYDENNLVTSAKVESQFDLSEINNAEIKDKLPKSHTLTFNRNAFGDITKATTDDGQEVGYGYDTFGRQTEIRYPNGTKLVYEYDKKNQLTKICNGEAITEYHYDGLGQITEIQQGDGSKSAYKYRGTGEIEEAVTYGANGQELSKQQYTYDENGNTIKEELTYPKFKLTKAYEYDEEDQLIKVTEKEKNTTRVTTYLYDNVGNRIATKLEVNGESRGYQEWKHNADNQLEEITGEKGATYEYDANGHVSKKKSVTGEVITYLYDTEGRLIQESSNFGTQIGYHYDALGNRIAKAIGKECNRKLKTDLLEWMKGTDRESELSLSQGDVTLEDALNMKRELRCLPMKKRTWRIDHGQNRREETKERLRKPVDSERTIEIIQSVNDYTKTFVSPLQQTKTTYSDRVKTTEQATMMYDSRGTAIGDDLDTYHQDGLGSVITQTTNEAGMLYSNNLYQEFGRSERPINNQAGYRSQYHDNWKQQHLRAREYDTTTGRFQQQDTVLGQLKQPVTQNKYTYANNNPFMYRDDAGRWGWVSKAWNKAKKAVRSVARAVNRYVIQPIVRTVRRVVNTVTNFFRGAARTVTNVVSRSYQTARQVYNTGVSYASNSVRYFGNQVTYYGNQARNWVGTKAQQAQVWYQDTREYIVQQAQATRKKAEARIRKLCDAADKLWEGTKKAGSELAKAATGILTIGSNVGKGMLAGVINTVAKSMPTSGIGEALTGSKAHVDLSGGKGSVSYATGEVLGSLGTAVVGGLVAVVGAGMTGIGGAVTGGTGGAASAVSVPTAAAGLALTTAGANTLISGGVVAVDAGKNLVQQISGGDGGDTVTSNLGNTYDNTPSSNHTTTNENPGLDGEPNSSVDILGKDGSIKTRRWYDENGKQIRDLDMTDHGNPKKHPEVPHEHGRR